MHKPFIHCFKTAKEYYVYDVNTDKIIQVSFETYNFLENNIWDEKAEREIEKLINEGYLKRTRVEEVKHFATDFLESYLENRMNQLVLQVTQKCNLRCSYCVYSGDYKNRNHSQKEMSWETAKEAVDYLYGHSMSSEDIYISFYGGEPLLMFRLIKEVVEYVKREYCQRTVHFNLTLMERCLHQKLFSILLKIIYKLCLVWMGLKKCTIKIEYLQEVIEDHLKN